MTKQRILVILLLLMTSAVFSQAAAESYPPEGWVTDIKEAQRIAEEEDKLILLNFTGSDWCSWCIKLRNEIFTKEDFKEYADENLVLLFLDFPANISLSEDQQLHNGALGQVLGVQGYPTIIVLESDLTPRLKTGYTGASAADYAEHLGRDTNITAESAAAVGAELNRILPLLPQL